jgi:hypothetical protein
VALDPDGNEIIVPSDIECPLPETCGKVYLVVFWAERETDFVPVLGTEGKEERMVASRLEAETKSAMGLTEYAVLYGQARIQETDTLSYNR